MAASQAIREQIDGARERLDVMNAYLTDRGMIERIVAVAQRGVRVRVVVSKTSNNAQATAALKHHYADMLGAGVEVWELPETVVHAKVIVADDIVSFGTVNLDAWALYRNSEIMMIARSAEAAALFEERLFEPDIARSHPGEPPCGSRERPAELVVEQTRTGPVRPVPPRSDLGPNRKSPVSGLLVSRPVSRILFTVTIPLCSNPVPRRAA